MRGVRPAPDAAESLALDRLMELQRIAPERFVTERIVTERLAPLQEAALEIEHDLSVEPRHVTLVQRLLTGTCRVCIGEQRHGGGNHRDQRDRGQQLAAPAS